MKHTVFLYAALLVAIFITKDLSAQNTFTHNDSIAASLKLKKLQAKRDNLQNEIRIQDAKRNKQIAGVSFETLEEMNDRQDSLCLALRSQLVDVILEMQEKSSGVSPNLLQQYNNLVKKTTSTNGKTPTEQLPVKQPAKKSEH